MRSSLIRLTRSYRTVSNVALCVVVGVPPIELLMVERCNIYEEGQLKLQKQRKVEKWQEKWNNNKDKGQWIKKLLPNITARKDRKHGELDYALNQVLTGHRCFRQYLHRFGRADLECCPYCEDVNNVRILEPRWQAR